MKVYHEWEMQDLLDSWRYSFAFFRNIAVILRTPNSLIL